MQYQACVHSITGVNSLLENDCSCLITYISVAFLVNLTKVPLKSSYIVFAIGFYSRLCSNLGYFLSRVIIMTIGGLISMRRFEVTNFF